MARRCAGKICGAFCWSNRAAIEGPVEAIDLGMQGQVSVAAIVISCVDDSVEPELSPDIDIAQ